MVTYGQNGDYMDIAEKIESLNELIDYADAYMAEPNVPQIEKATAADMKAQAQKALLAIRMEMLKNGDID